MLARGGGPANPLGGRFPPVDTEEDTGLTAVTGGLIVVGGGTTELGVSACKTGGSWSSEVIEEEAGVKIDKTGEVVDGRAVEATGDLNL